MLFHEGSIITARLGDASGRWLDFAPLGSRTMSATYVAQESIVSEANHPIKC
jgi:hypothetical protein